MIKRIFTGFLVACFLLITVPSVNAVTFKQKTDPDPEKDWTITFNQEVDRSSLTKQLIYVKTASGDIHPTSFSLSDDLMKITVKPEKPYTIKTTYSLFISKEVGSKKGKKLKSDVNMDFEIQGIHIQDINATLNSFLTNVQVQASDEVAEIGLSVNGDSEQIMKQIGGKKFEIGLLGLSNGNHLTMYAYDKDSELLEKQTYEMSQ